MEDNFFIPKTKFQLWVERNRITWTFMIALTGLILGILGGVFLGSPIRQGVFMGISYSFILVLVEVSRGNE